MANTAISLVFRSAIRAAIAPLPAANENHSSIYNFTICFFFAVKFFKMDEFEDFENFDLLNYIFSDQIDYRRYIINK